MFLLSLALRNLRRHLLRTLLSTAAIVVGIFYLVMGQALVGGIEEGIIRAAEDGLTGQLLIRPAGYPEEAMSHPLDTMLDLPEAATAWLASPGRVSTERTLFVVTAISGGDSLRVRAIGFDPVQDEKVFRRDTWKVTGKIPSSAQDGVLLGSNLARLLKMEPGSRLVVQTRTHLGAINALELPVSGVVATANAAIDQSTLYLTRDAAATLVGDPRPTHVFVRFPDRNQALAETGGLGSQLGPCCEVRNWDDETQELLKLQKIRRQALNLLVGVLLLISAFGIANTILMAAHERVREVGTLRAMGMTRRGVMALFLMEGAFMGVSAGVVGALLGGGGAFWFAHHPIDLSMQGSAMSNVQYSTWLYAQFHPSMLIAPVFVSATAAILASIWPARVASSMQPADAVRG